MDLTNYTIFDIETNALVNSTKIHVLSYAEFVGGEWKIKSLFEYSDMIEFLSDSSRTLVGHNILLFDIPELERLLDIKIECEFLDTLPIVWYIFPNRIKEGKKYGLKYFGEDVGIAKPEVEDWENQDRVVYQQRCEEDCKITVNLLFWIAKEFETLYDSKVEDILRVWGHLQLMMRSIAICVKNPIKIDVEFTTKTLAWFTEERGKRLTELEGIMPKVPKNGTSNYPKKPYNKDGSKSATLLKREKIAKENGYPLDYEEPIEYPVKWEEPNPNSSIQVKDWLFSKGWEPTHYETRVSKSTGIAKDVPQIKNKDGNLCESIIELSEKYPELKALEDLSILTHRIGCLEGFISEMNEDGYVTARVGGFTNTLRLRHNKPLVNLPGVTGDKDFKDGYWVRNCMTAPEGFDVCGSDVSALENKTRDFYIQNLDPEYVRKMNEPGYEGHLEIGIVAGLITKQEAEFYKELKHKMEEEYHKPTDEGMSEFKRIHLERHKAKTTSYSAVYGVGVATLAKALKIKKRQAKQILDGYWKLNWSVKKFASTCKIKKIKGQLWVYAPIPKMWFSLRYEKDIFSTVNQASGSFLFFKWVEKIIKVWPKLSATFHDEVLAYSKSGYKDECSSFLRRCMEEVNEEYGLVTEITNGLEVSVAFGDSYSEVH